MRIEKEKKLELLCLLASGLLASGHYTKVDKEDGEASLKYYKDYFTAKDGELKGTYRCSAIEEAFGILQRFISEIE